MTTWEERMAPRPERVYQLDLLATIFRVQGPTKRPLRCALYRVETGLELRLEYEDRNDDVHQTQLFRDENQDAIAGLADKWHMALIDKGFTELAVL